MNLSLTRAEAIMLGGAAATLVFSFVGFAGSRSAWSTDALAFASTIPALLAVVMLGWFGLNVAGVDLPDEVLTFSSEQLNVTWGVSALGMMLAWATVDFGKDAAFWIQLIGSAAMAVGAVAGVVGKLSEPLTQPGAEIPPPPPPSTGGSAGDSIADES